MPFGPDWTLTEIGETAHALGLRVQFNIVPDEVLREQQRECRAVVECTRLLLRRGLAHMPRRRAEQPRGARVDGVMFL